MRLLCLTLVAAAAFGGDPQTRQILVLTGDSIIPQVVGGGVWNTTIMLINLDTVNASFTLRFYGNDGLPKAFQFVDVGTWSVLTGTIPVGGSVTIMTAGGSGIPDAEGWAQLETDQDVGGMAVFCQVVPGRPDFEAVVPISSIYDYRVVLPFDNTAGFVTAYAILNPLSYTSTTVTVAIRDQNGNRLYLDQFTLGPRQHVAFRSVDEWPITNGQRGVIELSTTSLGLSTLGLRFNPTGAFTSFHALSMSEW